MAVQFIFGGSGRGKTYFLQHKIMEEAVNNPKKDYIMIVPEQCKACIQSVFGDRCGKFAGA